MKPVLDSVHDAAPAHAVPACCSNCQAAVQDNFCSHCGEATAVHSPSAAEFIHEFVGHYVALEGKLWKTLGLLLFRPGRLTVDYLRGKRVSYINPLRLYLTLSVVMFALIKVVGVDLPQLTLDKESIGAVYKHSLPHRGDSTRSGHAVLSITATQDGGPDDFSIDKMLASVASVNAGWARNAQRFIAMPAVEKADLVNHGLLANLPYMLIGALPLFALYLKLIHLRSGRRYGEHLVFALHASAFVFLLACVMIVMPGNLGWLLACLHQRYVDGISAWDWVQLLPLAWIVCYLPAALRRVYGGTRGAAWVTALLLMAVHALVIVGLVIGAEVLAILKHG